MALSDSVAVLLRHGTARLLAGQYLKPTAPKRVHRAAPRFAAAGPAIGRKSGWGWLGYRGEAIAVLVAATISLALGVAVLGLAMFLSG